jgi:hypothetical membrane protein
MRWKETAAMGDEAGTRIKSFTDRHEWIGPAIFMLSALYFVAQIAVGWVWHPPYSLVNNTISDLGNSTCGRYGGFYVCSPRHDLMNAAFILLGLAMFTGSLLIYQEFTEREKRQRTAALVGFSAMGLGGLGAILVGVFPENSVSAMHITGAALAIGVGNLGILVLGLVLPLPESMRRYMLTFSTISLTALILFATGHYFGIGAGTMERIAAYPETIWLITFGMYISRNHYRNGATPRIATPGFFAPRAPTEA